MYLSLSLYLSLSIYMYICATQRSQASPSRDRSTSCRRRTSRWIRITSWVLSERREGQRLHVCTHIIHVCMYMCAHMYILRLFCSFSLSL